jgi:uncharacterized protein (DUF58 family)
MAKSTTRKTTSETGARLPAAQDLAARIPDLLIQARTIANTVIPGWHGRRRAGPGETFWQFRPFSPGEPAKRIDWRRSARDDHLYVREKEWEAAHTVWLWSDRSASMDFRSSRAGPTKLDRAIVLQLALADLLGRCGERVGIPGLLHPVIDRRAAQILATALHHAPGTDSLPEISSIRRFSDAVLISDFLDPIDEIIPRLNTLAATGARVHLVQILDPREESFAYAGRVEFRDPETGLRLTAGRAQSWLQGYHTELKAHRQTLSNHCRRLDWSFIVHHTHRPATDPLLALHSRLGDANRFANAAMLGSRPPSKLRLES